mmetsp:Transcript_75977/g.180719  ORF Transcript_75977/g.180719 Transcript_75977/m.180719 type:complete len:332 (+) Transcript_75977:33-1028(+)
MGGVSSVEGACGGRNICSRKFPGRSQASLPIRYQSDRAGVFEDDEELCIAASSTACTPTACSPDTGCARFRSSSLSTDLTELSPKQVCRAHKKGARESPDSEGDTLITETHLEELEDHHPLACPICQYVAAEKEAARLEEMLENERALAEMLAAQAEALLEQQQDEKVRQVREEEKRNFWYEHDREAEANKAAILNQPWWEVKADFKTLRAYQFKLRGELHQVAIAHSKFQWQIACDDAIVLQTDHDKTVFNREWGDMCFKVTALNGERVEARLRAKWPVFPPFWQYELWVNGYKVPYCWKRGVDRRKNTPVEVLDRAPPSQKWDRIAYQK